jgi:hypothetical protein
MRIIALAACGGSKQGMPENIAMCCAQLPRQTQICATNSFLTRKKSHLLGSANAIMGVWDDQHFG